MLDPILSHGLCAVAGLAVGGVFGVFLGRDAPREDAPPTAYCVYDTVPLDEAADWFRGVVNAGTATVNEAREWKFPPYAAVPPLTFQEPTAPVIKYGGRACGKTWSSRLYEAVWRGRFSPEERGVGWPEMFDYAENCHDDPEPGKTLGQVAGEFAAKRRAERVGMKDVEAEEMDLRGAACTQTCAGCGGELDRMCYHMSGTVSGRPVYATVHPRCVVRWAIGRVGCPVQVHGDQTSCSCGLTWDTNDPHPPACRRVMDGARGTP